MKSVQENEKQNTYLHECSNIVKLNYFLRKKMQFFSLYCFSFSILLYGVHVHCSLHVTTWMYYAGGYYLFKSFSDWGTDSNIIKISCHSRLFFVLHLLVNDVIVMAIARETVERVFILIQFFTYLRKQGWLFTLHHSYI